MRRITRPLGSLTLARGGRGLTGSTVGAVVSLIATGLAAAALAATPTVFLRAFDRSGVIAAGGNAVRIGGPVGCPAGDTVRLRATVSQAATGAVAEGSWSGACTGRNVHWHATAVVNDGAPFKAGCAHGVGLAIIRHNGRAVDATQWLSAVTLTTAHGAHGAAAKC